MATALATLNARLVASAASAGSTMSDATPAVTTLAQSTRSLSVATSYADGELPVGAQAMSAVTTKLTTPFNSVGESSVFTCLETQAPAPQPSTAIVVANRTTAGQYVARYKATVAAKVRVNFLQSITLNSTKLIDPNTGKRYDTVSITPGGTGYYTVDVTETDSTDWSAVTRGTQLMFESPPSGVAEIAQVIGMKSATRTYGALLTDSSGRRYTSGSGTSSSTTTALFGDVYSDVVFFAEAAASENVALGAELTVATANHVNGLSDTATVYSTPDATIPAGTTLSYSGLDSGTYYAVTTEAVSIGDSGSARVEVVSTVADPNAQMILGSSATFDPVLSNIESLAGAVSVTPAKFFPLEDAVLTYGASVQLSGRVKRETDGRYSAIIFTSPMGT